MRYILFPACRFIRSENLEVQLVSFQKFLIFFLDLKTHSLYRYRHSKSAQNFRQPFSYHTLSLLSEKLIVIQSPQTRKIIIMAHPEQGPNKRRKKNIQLTPSSESKSDAVLVSTQLRPWTRTIMVLHSSGFPFYFYNIKAVEIVRVDRQKIVQCSIFFFVLFGKQWHFRKG